MSHGGAASRYDVRFDDLACLWLEESYVLAITERCGAVEFTLEAVLTSGHPAYRSPAPDEQYCYRRAQLTVTGAGRPRLRLSGARPTPDPAGEPDLGNIDSLHRVNSKGPDSWAMQGDWGDLEVIEPRITVLIIDA